MAAFSPLSPDEENLLSTVYRTYCLPTMNPTLDHIESHQYYVNQNHNQINHPPPNLLVSPSFCTLPSNASPSLPQYIDHYGTKTMESTESQDGGSKKSPVSCEIIKTNSSNGPLITDQGFVGSGSNEEEENTSAKPHQMVPAKKSRKSSMKKNNVVESSNEGEVAKDFVLVRARRGQATDRHSIAERVRREKIRKRMRFLQDLVPGCCKATGKTVILDEIINYVKSLQNQIEFLSMKLCAASPRYDFSLQADKDFGFRQNASTTEGYGKTVAMMEPPEAGKCTAFNSYMPSGSLMDVGCGDYVGETSALPEGGAEEQDVQLESFMQQLLGQQGPLN